MRTETPGVSETDSDISADATVETPAASPPAPGRPKGRRGRRGGTASRRPSRKLRRAERLGLAPGESSFRHRVLPRSVIGIVTLVLAAAIGFAFGGTVLYAYYQSRLDKVETKVSEFIGGFEETYEGAREQIANEAELAKAEIREEIEPIKQLSSSGATLKAMIGRAQDSVYLVETLNEFGERSVGSAFVLTSDAERSYLVTSLSVVEASTRRPGPTISLRNGKQVIPATLHTWQEERDLALLIVNEGSLPRLKWAPEAAPIELGQRVFVIGGVGAAGGSITQGLVSDVSAAGIQHDAATTGPFAGGPLLNTKGEVLGVGTPEYAPLGYTSDRVTYASPIRATCEQILACPNNDAESAGGGPRR
ncbi:MAG: trypsin-like peptidase domain-containing protein [Acidimicrobiia bacterium]